MHKGPNDFFCSVECSKFRRANRAVLSRKEEQGDRDIYWYYAITFRISPLSYNVPPFKSEEHAIRYYRYLELMNKKIIDLDIK